MILASGEELLTVKNIARKISFDQSEDGIARTMRQVRHWTQNDLLRTTSVKNTGKGVPRLYDPEPTVEVAAILLELSRYGVTVEVLKPVADELWDTDEGMMSIGMALTDLNSYLQVSWNADPVTGVFTDAVVHTFDDLELGAQKYYAINAAPSSSILINMTQVMARVYNANTD